MPDRTVERREDDGSLERSIFASFARWIEQQLGQSTAFVLAILSVGLWAASGPFFGWSDTWQLVINTGTTIVTFLMVFVIQNTQNRDTKALQLKLDELIRANTAARNSLMSLEEKSEPEVEEIKSAFVELASTGEATARARRPPAGRGRLMSRCKTRPMHPGSRAAIPTGVLRSVRRASPFQRASCSLRDDRPPSSCHIHNPC
jgi:low affinity Fe/Cu permease